MTHKTISKMLILSLTLVVGVSLFILADDLVAEDWRNYYLRALHDWNHRFDYGVYNPPWLVVPLYVLYHGFGDNGGYAVLGALSTAIIGWSAYRLSPDQHPGRVLLAVVNLPMLFLIVLGQIDGLAACGLTLAILSAPLGWQVGGLGFITAMLKPQVTLGAAIISFSRYQVKGKLLAVGAAFILVSLLLWGGWLLQTEGLGLVAKSWNRAFPIFPLGWVIGLPLMGYGLWKQEEGYGLLAMPFLVPYYGPHSFALMTAHGVARLPLRWCWVAWLLPTLYIVIYQG